MGVTSRRLSKLLVQKEFWSLEMSKKEAGLGNERVTQEEDFPQLLNVPRTKCAARGFAKRERTR